MQYITIRIPVPFEFSDEDLIRVMGKADAANAVYRDGELVLYFPFKDRGNSTYRNAQAVVKQIVSEIQQEQESK